MRNERPDIDPEEVLTGLGDVLTELGRKRPTVPVLARTLAALCGTENVLAEGTAWAMKLADMPLVSAVSDNGFTAAVVMPADQDDGTVQVMLLPSQTVLVESVYEVKGLHFPKGSDRPAFLMHVPHRDKGRWWCLYANGKSFMFPEDGVCIEQGMVITLEVTRLENSFTSLVVIRHSGRPLHYFRESGFSPLTRLTEDEYMRDRYGIDGVTWGSYTHVVKGRDRVIGTVVDAAERHTTFVDVATGKVIWRAQECVMRTGDTLVDTSYGLLATGHHDGTFVMWWDGTRSEREKVTHETLQRVAGNGEALLVRCWDDEMVVVTQGVMTWHAVSSDVVELVATEDGFAGCIAEPHNDDTCMFAVFTVTV